MASSRRLRRAGLLATGAGVLALLAAGVVALAALAPGPGEPDSSAARASAPAPRTRAFDSRRAWRDLRAQVAVGPRPAGSPQLARLAERLRRRLPRGRFEAVPGHPGLRNVVGRLPGRRPAVVVGAHLDTKALPGFVGANDGASGVAVAMELARVLARDPRPRGARELRFVLFDGEESPDDGADFYATGLRGSKAYAARHAEALGALVLLDFVGDRDLRIPREAGSDPALWARLRLAARRAGTQATFPGGRARPEILDDHTPFARRGVPAIDLIDFDFPCFHRTCDDLSAVAERSLDAVGEAAVGLVRELRRAGAPGEGD